jgi:hypothetical protein
MMKQGRRHHRIELFLLLGIYELKESQSTAVANLNATG